nr:ATP-dependent RNA helicase DBP2-like [Rhipicephalus microplus]
MAAEDFIIQFNNPPDAFGGLGPALPPFNGPNEGFIAPAVRPESPFFGLARERYPVIGDTSTTRMCLGRGIGAGNPAGQSHVRGNLCPPDWARIPLPSYEKDCFRDRTVTSQRSSEEVEAFRKANDVVVTARDMLDPILHIEEASFPEFLRRNIEARNTGSSVTALQAQCWPVALRGQDLVAFSKSASEENALDYLAPGIVHVQRQPAVPLGCGPIVLVLTVTQEAAQQVRVVSDLLVEGSGMRTMCIVCGNAKRPQLKQLEEGAEICVATPGRLVAFMENCKINLNRCT